MTIPGFTSTGSKRPEALFGPHAGGPELMTRAHGCQVWDDQGHAYVDMTMALGAVALGYGHPDVVAAVQQAVRDGTVGPLPPVLERVVAGRLTQIVPGGASVRFLKTGAEAVAAAVRIARTYTGRENVVTCGYHGWLDWCQSGLGVPTEVQRLRREVEFNDPDALDRAVAECQPVAAVILEPVIDGPPNPQWLRRVREMTHRSGTVLIFDEIKTALRIAKGGAAERYGVEPDLVVVGKALGNGFPVAAVCGHADLMSVASDTWISSTLATEYVGLAAANAVLDVYERLDVIGHLRRTGGALFRGLSEAAEAHPHIVEAVKGVPEMCYLRFRTDDVGGAAARALAKRGVLFRRTAYNFVSLAHTAQDIDRVLAGLQDALTEVDQSC